MVLFHLLLTDEGQFTTSIGTEINVKLGDTIRIPKNSYVKVHQVYCEKDVNYTHNSLLIFCREFSNMNSQFADLDSENNKSGFLCVGGEFNVNPANEVEYIGSYPTLPLNNSGEIMLNELNLFFLNDIGQLWEVNKITKFYMTISITDNPNLV
jgi:hypothetical protein